MQNFFQRNIEKRLEVMSEERIRWMFGLILVCKICTYLVINLHLLYGCIHMHINVSEFVVISISRCLHHYAYQHIVTVLDMLDGVTYNIANQCRCLKCQILT